MTRSCGRRYSDKWLWEEAALGTGGENICFDPLGSHTRAFITDVRPKLFDGAWKENVGGGDFLLLFGADGKLQYLKEMVAQLHTSGPCLSDAEYAAVTVDGAVAQHLRVRGARTDDLVRVFIDIELQVLQATDFSRMVFFQLGSETYNYQATFARFVWGSAAAGDRTELPRTCSAGASKASAKLYSASRPLRAALNGTAPWWVAFEDVDHAPAAGKESMKVGDRGLVIREFEARLGGAAEVRSLRGVVRACSRAPAVPSAAAACRVCLAADACRRRVPDEGGGSARRRCLWCATRSSLGLLQACGRSWQATS